MPRTTYEKRTEKTCLNHIRKFGWHCANVRSPKEGERTSSYSVGLFHTYGHPELLVYGLPHPLAQLVIGLVAGFAQRGEPLNLNGPTEILLAPCEFVPVPQAAYARYVGLANWYYEGNYFPVMQIIWPADVDQFPYGLSGEMLPAAARVLP